MTRISRAVQILFFVGLSAVALRAQDKELQATRIDFILSNPARYLNEQVRIDGVVTRFVDARSKSTSFFYLKGDFGGEIRVRTSKDLPSVNRRYSIEGAVGLDPRTNELYVSEEMRNEPVKRVEVVVTTTQTPVTASPTPPLAVVPADAPEILITSPSPREHTSASSIDVRGTWRNLDPGTLTMSGGVQKAELKTETLSDTSGTFSGSVELRRESANTISISGQGRAGASVTATVEVTQAPGASNTWMYLLIGSAVVFVLAAAIVLMRRAGSEDRQQPDYSASTPPFEAPPPPMEVIEGRTIKLHAPPPNTVKLLPGWFEVTAGDDLVKQIRFYRLGGERGMETTFGRAAGRPYAHIQINAPTVSSRQAKVAFDRGNAQLTNFAASESNPTKVNGRELGVNESVDLSENDRVEMGEVCLLFHTAPTLVGTAST